MRGRFVRLSMLIVPIFLAVLATAVDLGRREIPDTLPLMLSAWAVASCALGWTPITWQAALAGFALGLAVGALSFKVGMLGGGDVKFLAALGAAIGPLLLAKTLLYMAIAGAALAVVAMARSEKELAYLPAITLGLVGCAVTTDGALSW